MTALKQEYTGYALESHGTLLLFCQELIT